MRIGPRLALVCLLAAGCPRASEGFLSLIIDSFDTLPVTATTIPTQTMSDTVQVEGVVVRSPPMRGLETTVTATGGAGPTTTRVMSTGRFRIRVPMRLNQLNQLVFTAEDDTGAIATPFNLAVTHVP